MSSESWKEEFYPKPARETTKEEAAAHSLRKWIGLRKENRDKHEVDRYPVSIDYTTCALCFHYDRKADGEGCTTCPLFEVLGKSCDDTSCGETSPFRRYTFKSYSDPEPMIAALQQVVDKEKALKQSQEEKANG